MAERISGESLWQWRSQAQQQAIAAGISVGEVDWLLQAVTGVDRLCLRLGTVRDRPHIPLDRSLADLTHCWQQRVEARVPLQYLVGGVSWRQFQLKVSPAVLIPRPETEEAIDLAVKACGQSHAVQTGHWADLGTGSGVIAIGLATALPQATIHAVDRSEAALAIARQNAQQCDRSEPNACDRIHFYLGDWFAPLTALKGQLAGMVSNPPYIPSAEIAQLQPEVCQHEPHLALDGGTDGLDCLRHLVSNAPLYLRSGGIWLVEMMAGQAESVTQLLEQQGSYTQIQVFPDLSGIDRFVLAYRI
jgi:release factor glutamine methyltransferase